MGDETYNTKWYVAIELNYDMTNNSPNYQMTIVTENDERELPYYGHYTYEYDYVDVKNSSISEWRKFCMDNDHRLVKDSAHSSFNSYVEEGCIYNVDACSWYKNGIFYKNKRTRLAGEEAKTVGEALFTDLGLNATEINAEKFFNKSGTQNSVLKTCYDEFTKIAKEDIIYDLVCKEESHDEQKVATSIRALNEDLSGGAENYQVPGNTTIRQLVSGFTDNFGERVNVHLYYFDQHEGRMNEITDLVSLRYFIKERNRDEAVETNLDEPLSNVVERAGFTNRDLTIAFLDYNNIGGLMNFYYAGEFPSTYTKPEFPQVLKNLGVPEYDGERITYGNNVLDKSPYKLEIQNTNGNEEAQYRTKLLKNGFEFTEVFGNGEYKKKVGSLIVTISINNAAINSGFLLITIGTSEAPNELIINSIALVGSFNNWDVNTNCVEFTKSSETSWFLHDLHLSPGEKFKIVINHSWEIHGGYGWNDISNIAPYSKILASEGEEGNILANVACAVAIEANINGEEISFNLISVEQEF